VAVIVAAHHVERRDFGEAVELRELARLLSGVVL